MNAGHANYPKGHVCDAILNFYDLTEVGIKGQNTIKLCRILNTGFAGFYLRAMHGLIRTTAA
jgi:hypothetical protein